MCIADFGLYRVVAATTMPCPPLLSTAEGGTPMKFLIFLVIYSNIYYRFSQVINGNILKEKYNVATYTLFLGVVSQIGCVGCPSVVLTSNHIKNMAKTEGRKYGVRNLCKLLL